MKRVVIIGDGGHSSVVADIVYSNPGMSVHAVLDDRYKEVFREGEVIKGPVEYLPHLVENKQDIGVVIGIGSNLVRKRVVARVSVPRQSYITIVHPSAVVSPTAQIGAGTVVMPNAVIQAKTIIGDHAIINTGSIVEHDSKLDDYVHVCPGAVVTGGVHIGEGTQIGARASVIPQKKIGSWSIVGAGAVVVTNLENDVTAVGVPAHVQTKGGMFHGQPDSIVAASYERQ